MSIDIAIRFTEILLGFAFFQQSIEHLRAARLERYIFIPRIMLGVLLMLGVPSQWVLLALLGLALCMLKRFNGPYNGGSDRMSLLILCCLCAAHFMPTLREYLFGYLALQLMLSYFIAGWVKLVNPEWRNGRALQEVFLFSAYPVSESLRDFAKRPRLLLAMSWAVMLFEVLFPLALLTPATLIIGLAVATLFHLANACLFGLNRFFWIWIAAYPSIIWLQHRIAM